MMFERPWWLAGGVVACAALVFLWVLYDRRQSAALTRFVSAGLRVQLTRSISVAKRGSAGNRSAAAATRSCSRSTPRAAWTRPT
jgi:hypothetical protein